MRRLFKNITLKNVWDFLIYSGCAYVLVELAERLVDHFLHINLNSTGTTLGLITFIVVMSFKFHITCCLLPFFYGLYKAKHKKCIDDCCH